MYESMTESELRVNWERSESELKREQVRNSEVRTPCIYHSGHTHLPLSHLIHLLTIHTDSLSQPVCFNVIRVMGPFNHRLALVKSYISSLSLETPSQLLLRRSL